MLLLALVLLQQPTLLVRSLLLTLVQMLLEQQPLPVLVVQLVLAW